MKNTLCGFTIFPDQQPSRYTWSNNQATQRSCLNLLILDYVWLKILDRVNLHDITFISGHFVFVFHFDERGHGHFKHLVHIRWIATDFSPLPSKTNFAVAAVHLY